MLNRSEGSPKSSMPSSEAQQALLFRFWAFPWKLLRDEDKKNTEKPENLFKKQKGCCDWDVFNHVPAVIQQTQLDAALESSKI